MEHTAAYLKDDLRREQQKTAYLYQVIKGYAPHLINDVDHMLKECYPGARPKEFYES